MTVTAPHRSTASMFFIGVVIAKFDVILKIARKNVK